MGKTSTSVDRPYVGMLERVRPIPETEIGVSRLMAGKDRSTSIVSILTGYQRQTKPGEGRYIGDLRVAAGGIKGCPGRHTIERRFHRNCASSATNLQTVRYLRGQARSRMT